MTTPAHTWHLVGATDMRDDLTDQQVYDLAYAADADMTTTPLYPLRGVADIDLVDHTLLRVEGVDGTTQEWKREEHPPLSVHVLLYFTPDAHPPAVTVYRRLVDAAEDAHIQAENLAANTTGDEFTSRTHFAEQMGEEFEELRRVTPSALDSCAAANLPIARHVEWNSPFGERWEVHRAEAAEAADMLHFQALN